MKKSKVVKTKKKSRKGKVILASATLALLAVGFGGRSAFAGLVDILGGSFPWLGSILNDTSGLELQAPNFDLVSGLDTITSGGAGIFSTEVSKLLHTDGTMDLSQDPLTAIQNVGFGSLNDDGSPLDFTSMKLAMGETSLLTSATASMATSTHATSNNEIAKRASEESGKVFKEAGEKSYSSSLEAQEELNKNVSALGKLTVSGIAHQKTANDYKAIDTANTLKQEHDNLVDKKRTAVTSGAFQFNNDVVTDAQIRSLRGPITP
jgi:hypothetical protein